MSKKNIVLILFLVCFLTIMAISIWGKKAEMSSRVVVESLAILDTDGLEITSINDTSRKEKKISLNIEEEIESYAFKVVIYPQQATDLSLKYTILQGEEYINIEEVNIEKWYEFKNLEIPNEEKGLKNIHYFIITFTEKKIVNICFETNKTDTIKRDYLMFNWEGVKHSDVIE